MTDKEIIKTLRERIHSGKWIGKGFLDKTDYLLLTNSLDLITSQQKEIKEWKRVVETWQMQHEKDKAEIERLEAEDNRFADIGKMYSEIRAEAIKEFAEMLKEKRYVDDCWQDSDGGDLYSYSVYLWQIDNLVQEMVGEE